MIIYGPYIYIYIYIQVAHVPKLIQPKDMFTYGIARRCICCLKGEDEEKKRGRGEKVRARTRGGARRRIRWTRRMMMRDGR